MCKKSSVNFDGGKAVKGRVDSVLKNDILDPNHVKEFWEHRAVLVE